MELEMGFSKQRGSIDVADAVTNGPAIFSDDKGEVDKNSPRFEDLDCRGTRMNGSKSPCRG